MRLTPNQRMAIYLSKVNSSSISRNISSSITSDSSNTASIISKNLSPVYSFSNWIIALWENLRNSVPEANLPQILSQGEQEFLIEKIIEDIIEDTSFNDSFNQNELPGNLFKSAALARLIIDAYHLIQEWCLENEENLGFNSHYFSLNSSLLDSFFEIGLEKKLYQQTIVKYHELSQANNWIDQVSLPAKIMAITKENTQILDKHETALCKQLRKLLPKKIECIGFLEWTPRQKEFHSWLKNLNVAISDTSLLKTAHLHPSPHSNPIQNPIPHQNSNLTLNSNQHARQKTYVISAANPLEELQLAVKYARNWLNTLKSSESSESSISSTSSKSSISSPNSAEFSGMHSFAIVIPDLNQRRAQIERILKQNFSLNEFNISAPLALMDYPLIHSAFVLLHLLQEAGRWEVKLDTISQFLLSPFFAASPKSKDLLSIRASIDIFLRENREREYSVKRLLQLLEYFNKSKTESQSAPGCEAVITLLNNLFTILPNLSKKQKAAEWREICIKILETGQWLPCSPSLISCSLLSDSELQQKTQWEELLEDYLQMDRVLGPHSFNNFIIELKRLAKLKRFLPENSVSVSENGTSLTPSTSSNLSALTAPIQVLGLLEAQGLPFDAIWVVGLHQGIWPAPPDPNPFIPLPLQKKYNIPRSTPARELMIAKKIMAEWQRATDHLIFSYPTSIGTDICEKSALLDEFDEISPEDLGIECRASYFVNYFNTSLASPNDWGQVSTFEKLCPKSRLDTFGTFLDSRFRGNDSNLNNTILPGGTLALKLQSACPFRAFAEIRLKAKPLKKPSLGLNEAERGEIIHQILQDFWTGIKSQAKLLSLTHSEVEQYLSNITHSVFDHWQERNARLLKPRYRTIEQKRMLRLILEYIDLERKRAPFEIVAEEVLEVVNLGELRFYIRIDRIDKIASGEEILIDYKTGKVSISDWFGERPNDPQLPTYCLTRDPKPKALAFAIIRPESIHYSGLIDERIVDSANSPIPGLKTSQQMNRYGAEQTWEEQCDAWKTTIERLAQDFSEGIADVDPKEGPNTCRTCSLQMLCRIT